MLLSGLRRQLDGQGGLDITGNISRAELLYPRHLAFNSSRVSKLVAKCGQSF
jgi:hypothetical protein